MKKHFFAFAFLSCVGCGWLTQAEKQDINTALNDIQRGCIIANVLLPIPLIKQACDIADIADPAIEQIVNEEKARQKARDAYAREVAMKKLGFVRDAAAE